MYMREMGTVDLLTREGEIKIAKRIEQGLNQALRALSTFPPTIDALLNDYQRVQDGNLKLTDMVSAFLDPAMLEQTDEIPTPKRTVASEDGNNDDEEEEAVDLGPDPEEAEQRFKKLKRTAARLLTSVKKTGTDSKPATKIRDDLTNQFLELKLTPKLTDRLTGQLRQTIDRIRTQERALMAVCVREAKMPRKDFISAFAGNETNPNFLRAHARKDRQYGDALKDRMKEIKQCFKSVILYENGKLIVTLNMLNR